MDNINLVIVGNMAFDINTFPKRDNGNDKIVKNNRGFISVKIKRVKQQNKCNKSKR